MLIGLISDTHGVFSQEFKEFLSPVDELWHAGDFGADAQFAKSIAAFKPLVGVSGNCDGQDTRELYPNYAFFEREGARVLMMHIGGHPGRYCRQALSLIDSCKPTVFVCGHSHILKVQWDEQFSMMTLNPGAAGLSGWQIYRTALRFKLEGGKISDMEVFKLPRQTHTGMNL